MYSNGTSTDATPERFSVNSADHDDSTDHVKGCSCGMADHAAPGHDGALEDTTADNDGLVEIEVDGIDARIYAHRSNTEPGALLVGVDAPERQKILFVVNDGDLLDTIVGDHGHQASPHHNIAKGRKLIATEEVLHGFRDHAEIATDAIANILLHRADTEGVDAASTAVDSAIDHFERDWIDARRTPIT